MAHPSAPEQSLAEVIAAAKREPAKLNIGTPPPGTQRQSGRRAVQVAGRRRHHHRHLSRHRAADHGSARRPRQARPQRTGAAMSMLKAGSLKPLAVLASRRSSHLPDTPTSAEAGLPGFESGLKTTGCLAPAERRTQSSSVSISRFAPHRHARRARPHRRRWRRPAAVDPGGIPRRHRARGRPLGRADPQAPI